MTSRRALVTGATGFVGRHLATRLRADGWEVTAIQRPTSVTPTTFMEVGIAAARMEELSDLAGIIEEASPDAIFHLAAAQSRGHAPSDAQTLLNANVAFGTRLLEAATGRDLVLVNALSYFQFRHGEPTAHSLYSASKQAFAEVVRFYRDQLGLDARGVVLYDNYGADDTRDKLIPALLRAAKDGIPVTTGPVEQPLNLLHVDDVAAGLIAAAAHRVADTVTVRADDTTTVGEIIAAVEQRTGARLNHTVDFDRALSTLPLEAGDWPLPQGWRPVVELPDGLQSAFAAMA